MARMYSKYIMHVAAGHRVAHDSAYQTRLAPSPECVDVCAYGCVCVYTVCVYGSEIQARGLSPTHLQQQRNDGKSCLVLAPTQTRMQSSGGYGARDW